MSKSERATIRVLHVLPSLGVGGAETLIAGLARALADENVRGDIAVLGPSPTGSTVPVPGQVHVVSLATHRFDPRGWLRLRRLAREYDVVHAHLFPCIWLVGALVKGPKVVTEHSPSNRRREQALPKLVDRVLYRTFDAIIAISDGVLESLAQHLRIDSRRIHRVYNGIQLEDFNCTLASPDGAPFEVVAVGTLDGRKNMSLVMRAIAAVPDARLTVLGDGPERAALEDLARHLGGSVRLVGRTDVRPYLETAHAFVSGSRYEGFGIAALEALASGVVVIAPDIPGLREVVGDRDCLYPPGDGDALRERIVHLSGDRERWRARSSAAKAQARHFPMSETVREHAEIYRGLVA